MLTITSLEKIKLTFDKKIATSGLILPAEHLREHPRGSIKGNGWRINYHYSTEEGEDYLEYFASHRMTNDMFSFFWGTTFSTCDCSDQRTFCPLSG